VPVIGRNNYLKKAASPYNPKTKYSGPERIVVENGYVRRHKADQYTGFIAAGNISQAETHFERWYGADALDWLEQFQCKRNEDRGLLATVDMAATELQATGENVGAARVKHIIDSNPEWKPKLSRPAFFDDKVAEAVRVTESLFGRGTFSG
jgi:type I restriction enzyme S subunit